MVINANRVFFMVLVVLLLLDCGLTERQLEMLLNYRACKNVIFICNAFQNHEGVIA
jgi:hypothetical protein